MVSTAAVSMAVARNMNAAPGETAVHSTPATEDAIRFPAADAQPGQHEGRQQDHGLMAARGEPGITGSEEHRPGSQHPPWHRPGPVFGDPRLAPYRLGSSPSKAVVLDSYHRRCAISGTHIPPVLQAAHIRPVAKGGEHRLDSGLLLRSDIHTLFDCGYLGVDPQHRLLVSPRLRAEFSNGDQFYAKQGQVIDLPERRADRPGREFLEWHLEEVFLKTAAR